MTEPSPRDGAADFTVDVDRLKRRAFHYLQRYAASEAQLAAVLRRRLLRDARAAGQGLCEGEARRGIEAVVARCRDIGILDDRSFAETKVASARRKGHSADRIARALGVKGVDPALVGAALAAEGGDDRQAALVFARRKRLGPFRREAGADLCDLERREIALLCRNGFDYGLARRIVRLSPEEAEALPDDGL